MDELPKHDDQRFQLLVSGISDYAIYMLDPDGRVNSWNVGAQRFKGYVASEIIGEHFSRFHTPEDRAAGLPERALKQALDEGKYEGEGWRVRKDGSRFWASVVIDPIHDGNGRFVGYAKITRDITERRNAQEALRESERNFRLLMNGVTDYAIYMLSPTGIVSNWNAGAERIKGYSESDIVGQHFSRFHSPEDQAAGIPAMSLATAARVGRYETEGRRLRKDGSGFLAHVIIDAIRDENGQLLGFAKITRDITEKHKAAQDLELANAALFQSQKLQAIGQLTGGVAHDFNNLLAVISSGLDVMSMMPQLRAEPKLLESMRRAVDRGATLNQQLLSFARQQPLQPGRHNINDLVDGFESVLQRAVNAGIEFDIQAAPGLWTTMIDAARFEATLLNLVVNARDAMPEGGQLLIQTSNIELLKNQVGTLDAGPYVRVLVADTGHGMTPEVASRVFDPFFTTKEVGKGTGLGLSQVHGLINQSGGDVHVESSPGAGARISLYLPAIDTHAEPVPEVRRTERILIVDDEPDLLDMASSLCRSIGYDVLIATSGAEAMKVVQRHPDIDVLFTDVVMPQGTNGIQLARWARSKHPNMHIVLASGHPLPALRSEHGDLAEFEFIAKPYRLAEMAAAVRSQR